mmetsp:Transcript_11689/g.13228  ORF Transcript_11689/g.13228 Transcript_11689/m.13228 type:complete len:116 (+) Transcript_11689:351-698(+)
MVMLPRSKKMLPKPDNFPLSNKMIKFALKSSNSIDSLQSGEESQSLGDPQRFRKHSISKLIEEESSSQRGWIDRFGHFWVKKLKYLFKILKSRKFKLVEIMLILRPVIYMYMHLK